MARIGPDPQPLEIRLTDATVESAVARLRLVGNKTWFSRPGALYFHTRPDGKTYARDMRGGRVDMSPIFRGTVEKSGHRVVLSGDIRNPPGMWVFAWLPALWKEVRRDDFNAAERRLLADHIRERTRYQHGV